MATSPDQKKEARAKREAAQAAAAAKAKRARNLQYLAGAVFAALVVIVVIVAINGSSGEERAATTSEEVSGTAETKSLLAGVPNRGFTIGEQNAPVSIVEFVDLQCPFCREDQLDQQPRIISELVKTGKAKLRLAPLGFLGPDSEDARVVMARLAPKNLAWAYANLFYWNQGEENTGYVTDDFLKKITLAAGGTEADISREPSAAETKIIDEVDALREQLLPNGPSTPTYAVGKSGADPSTFKVVEPGSAGFAEAVIAAANDVSGT